MKQTLFLDWSGNSKSPRGVMANELDCDIVVSEFELRSRYDVYFWINHIYQPLRSGRIWHKVNF